MTIFDIPVFISLTDLIGISIVAGVLVVMGTIIGMWALKDWIKQSRCKHENYFIGTVRGDKLIPEAPACRRDPPERTEEMRVKGLKWAKGENGLYFEVCDFCGGNCGQCGLTNRIGSVPVSMQHMVSELYKKP